MELYEKKYTHVFVILMSHFFSSNIEIAKKAIKKFEKKINIQLVDSNSLSSGLGVLVIQVAEAIKDGFSVEQISLLIEKQVPLIYSIGTVGNLSDFMDENIMNSVVNEQQFVFNGVLEFYPLFTINPTSGEINIQGFEKSMDDVISSIQEQIIDEVQYRGGYVNKILISYHNMKSESKKLKSLLEKLYSHTTVTMIENSPVMNSYLGKRSITVSIS
jgi:Uncharacterized protein conserved in bacteria